ncbi:carbon-monoxide dehydrogenase medium subunit [Mumia flava]|uniref:Carbon-monoxide dehydrogenase medium subunit n=1 Tax=Mumia flava TaxID=1348852 RepID=A0A0B2BEU9_9ACTN|nr:carbon-monoxide dehydrogenase medium subunit [Mumia flava]
MKPAPFEYVRARSLHEAAELLAADPDAKVLAGGQSLVPMLSMRLARPARLVDVGRIEHLAYVDEVEGHLEIGATATQTQVATHPLTLSRVPILSAGIARIGHTQIRNRGTVCGSLAHHDPSAELPALALALDARLTSFSVRGPVSRTADAFFTGTFDTALDLDEVLTSVQFAMPPEGTGWSFREVARRSGDFALVGVGALLHTDDAGVVDHVRISLFGVGSTPVRVRAVEDRLLGTVVDEPALDAAAEATADQIDPTSDAHASADYRREVAAHLVQEALAEAWATTRRKHADA